MVEPTTERDSLLDFKGFHQFLEAIALRAIADHGEASQVASQKRGSGAQTDVAGLSANQATNENQLKFRAWLWTTHVSRTQRERNAILWDKKQLVVMLGKFGAHVGRSGYDRCRATIRGPGKRHKAVQIPDAKVQSPLVRLAETGSGP
jgi:hypothetical protein